MIRQGKQSIEERLRSIPTTKTVRRLARDIEGFSGGRKHEFETGDSFKMGNDLRVHYRSEGVAGYEALTHMVEVCPNVVMEDQLGRVKLWSAQAATLPEI